MIVLCIVKFVKVIPTPNLRSELSLQIISANVAHASVNVSVVNKRFVHTVAKVTSLRTVLLHEAPSSFTKAQPRPGVTHTLLVLAA